ncbi:MAG: zinc ABC transporter solute-binding protein [Planctomycetes bacterium]|nr:zinc ABC transporter solute-binding protein [Planctomycetota bacterium]
MRTILAYLLIGTVGLLVSCGREAADAEAAGRPSVVVSVLPHAYLVERIAAGHVDVHVLVGAGQNPHTFEPTPRQVSRLGRADLFFTIGAPFEQTIVRKLSSGGRLRVVDTRRGIELATMEEHGGHDHDHHEGDLDPHVWMSPPLAAIQARTMCDALVELDGAHRDEYEANLRQLAADLDAADAEIAAVLAPLKGRTLYVFHPAFGYFARRYGLVQRAVETGGKSPAARDLKALIDQARGDGVRVIFVQPQFSDHAARTVAEQIGGAVVPIDPLARDYLGNLRRIAGEIRRALDTQ